MIVIGFGTAVERFDNADEYSFDSNDNVEIKNGDKVVGIIRAYCWDWIRISNPTIDS